MMQEHENKITILKKYLETDIDLIDGQNIKQSK
jgi:hypothetical protein